MYETYEFLALMFDDLENADKNLKWMSYVDAKIVKNIIVAISLIEDETENTAQNIFNQLNGVRVSNFIRLLSNMKYKTLAKKLKAIKNAAKNNVLSITAHDIKASLGVVEQSEIENLLDKAKKYVTLNPSNNDMYSILTYLNNERHKNAY
jgi:hypothetical protein